MPRVNIYVPAMKLKVIDLYCKEKKHNRSDFLTNCALSLINASRGIKCDFCFKPAVGEYNLTIYDLEKGETKMTKKLCQYHLQKAKSEGAVEEVK